MIKTNTLDCWDSDYYRGYDYVYIVPTKTKTSDGYKTATFIGQIGTEIKIIDSYDCANNGNMKDGLFMFDFESPYGGIKVWGTRGQITCICGSIGNLKDVTK